MLRAGRLNKRVAFARRDSTADAYGNVSAGGWTALFTVAGGLRESTGRERIQAGALQAPMAAMLTVRSSSLTRLLTEADSAVIDGVRWNIRSIANPDQRNQRLELTVEREVAN
jgi:SPP1 family predicted phage head-tail adaptor